jgi:hypothetical protein
LPVPGRIAWQFIDSEIFRPAVLMNPNDPVQCH